MEIQIPWRVQKDLQYFADKHCIKKIVLFGSRARGTNTKRSDIDLAVSGGDFDGFYHDIMEHVHSLLSFDLIDLDSNISEELRELIQKEGIQIYEKG